MKLTLICLSIFVAAASSAPQFPFLPSIGSPLLPVQPCAQDKLGRLIPSGGLVYPGPVQENIQIGSWPWGPMGLTPFYPTDPRFLVLPGTGYPVAPTVTTNVVKPTVSITSDEKSKLDPINKEGPKSVSPVAPIAPAPPTAAEELKPNGLLSSTPTVAARSRCLQDYRRPKYEVPQNANYMVGSDIALKNQFPFLVNLLHWKETPEGYALARCGGSLITPTKILTAAHCVTNKHSNRLRPLSEFQVLLGLHFWNATTNDAQLTKNIIDIKIHEEYQSDKSKTLNDIAILTMDAPVQYTETISPVCLVPDCINDENEQEVTAMGWGTTKFRGTFSDFLRTAEFTTVPNNKCRETYKDLVDNQMLCAYKEGKDTCQGDSGGPLVIDFNKGRQSGFENSCAYMQVGIVSYGKGCAKIGTPGVYARVKNYLPWILANSK